MINAFKRVVTFKRLKLALEITFAAFCILVFSIEIFRLDFIAVPLLSGISDSATKYYSLDIQGDPPVLRFYKLWNGQVTSFEKIEFYETDNFFGHEKLMWSISPLSNTKTGKTLARLEYGKLPDGWHALFPANHLTMERDHR